MEHHHHHHVHPTPDMQKLNRSFIVGIVLNIVFVLAEAGAGFYYDSLALLSDAGHNLSDVVSLVLAMFALRLSMAKPSLQYTYGYKKSTVLVSLLNAAILFVAVAVILYESIEKFSNPTPLDGGAIAWVAAIGIVINAFTAYLFFADKSKDLNVKGAYLHMAADTLVSVGVLVSGIVIKYTGWNVIDPIIGIVVGLVILYSTWHLLQESLRLALDGVPEGIDVQKVETVLSSDPDVLNVATDSGTAGGRKLSSSAYLGHQYDSNGIDSTYRCERYYAHARGKTSVEARFTGFGYRACYSRIGTERRTL